MHIKDWPEGYLYFTAVDDLKKYIQEKILAAQEEAVV